MRNPLTTITGFGTILAGLAAAITKAVEYGEQATPYLLAIAVALAGLGNVFAKDADLE